MIDIAYSLCWIGSGQWLTIGYDANITCLTDFYYTVRLVYFPSSRFLR